MELEPIESQPVPLPEIPSTEKPPRRDLWGYWDLLGFLFFAAAALGISAVGAAVASAALSRFFGVHAPMAEPPYMVYWALGVQGVWWVFALAYMYYVVAVKYQQPFLSALGFLPQRAPMGWFVAFGIGLAIAVGVIGQQIGAPTDTPLTEMLSDAQTLWLIGVFAVLVGPIFEEMTFRGFLFRPLERYMGGIAAIVVTSVIFTLPHGSQYGWSWQILVLLFCAGAAFGTVRWKTGSLWPSIVMHVSYNGLQFVAFFLGEKFGDKLAP